VAASSKDVTCTRLCPVEVILIEELELKGSHTDRDRVALRSSEK